MTDSLAERRQWVEEYFASTNAMVKRGRPVDTWYSCPVCGYPTLSARGDHQICGLCRWEDDGLDDPDLGVRCGPNADYSLLEARQNWDSHRTMYRSGPGFDAAAADRPVREVVIAIFDAIRRLDYRAHYRLRQLWRIASELTGADYVLRDRSER